MEADEACIIFDQTKTTCNWRHTDNFNIDYGQATYKSVGNRSTDTLTPSYYCIYRTFLLDLIV